MAWTAGSERTFNGILPQLPIPVGRIVPGAPRLGCKGFFPLRFGLPVNTLNRMAATDLDVKYVAHLARLTLTAEEQQKFGAQLGQVLGYIEKLNQLDVSNVEPTAHAVPLVNVTRPDEIRPSLPVSDALRNAPAQANGLFLVPKIVE